jgi:hypothetical protein
MAGESQQSQPPPTHGRNLSPRTDRLFHRRPRAVEAFLLDTVLAEVAGALSRRGLRSVVLKGPAIATWLYDDPLERGYGDVDLLVAPATFHEAEQVLSEHRFVRRAPAEEHHTVWGRGPSVVELHRTLFWLGAPAERAWSTLTRETVRLTVAGADVEALAIPARSLLVALHAAQHATGEHAHPLDDLDRALAIVTLREWRAAASVAAELEAVGPFAAGLRLRPAGAALAEDLGLPHAKSRRLALWLSGPPDTAAGFERLATAGWSRASARLLVSELFPSSEELRSWRPLARRGRTGLLLAYCWRPLWLLWKAPAGLRAWLAAHRRTRHRA